MLVEGDGLEGKMADEKLVFVIQHRNNAFRSSTVPYSCLSYKCCRIRCPTSRNSPTLNKTYRYNASRYPLSTE